MILPLAWGIYLFLDPWEEINPLRGRMKLEMIGNCFMKADLKLAPKKVVIHGSRSQLVPGRNNCSAYLPSLCQEARLCCKLTFPVFLCFWCWCLQDGMVSSQKILELSLIFQIGSFVRSSWGWWLSLLKICHFLKCQDRILYCMVSINIFQPCLFVFARYYFTSTWLT